MVHGAHTQSCLLVLTTITPICPVMSRPYISDMFAATLPNASRIIPEKIRDAIFSHVLPKYGF